MMMTMMIRGGRIITGHPVGLDDGERARRDVIMTTVNDIDSPVRRSASLRCMVIGYQISIPTILSDRRDLA